MQSAIIQIMDVHIIFGLLGGILIAGSFIPYIRDILTKDTEPHIYTWFIWSVTQAIAAYAIFEGNGGLFAALSIASGALLSFVVFFMSFKHGTRNISDFDTATLIIALLAVIFWWKLDHPEWAVVAISTIDLLGFLPTFRKTWHEPHTESLTAWALFAVGNILAFFSLNEYSIMTSFYIITMIFASLLLVGIVLLRTKRSF
jgi:hypothetical protein